ncbi:hypothetical protein PanWU01x14_204900 [Parasponia andersonii]|uniref:Uncharacterized protein n=1 Tax=Parasponia andersonii TaxID=3476 RepID=A0A2P5BWD5_PARAD|nr:hypothetical protein PanWU01x14_204900 [Parasponia andersonii]
MADDVFGHKDLFSFHKKVSGPFAINGSLFGKSPDDGLNDTTSGNVGLSAAVLNSDDHARVVSNIASVSRQEKGHGPSFAQILSSSPRCGRDVTGSLVKSQTEVSMPHAVIIAPELSKPIIKGNYVCVRVNEQVPKKK